MASSSSVSTRGCRSHFASRNRCFICDSNPYNPAPAHWRGYPLEVYNLKSESLPYTCTKCRKCYHRECIGIKFDACDDVNFKCQNCDGQIVITKENFFIDIGEEVEALKNRRRAEMVAEPNHILFDGWASRYPAAMDVECAVAGEDGVQPITLQSYVEF